MISKCHRVESLFCRVIVGLLLMVVTVACGYDSAVAPEVALPKELVPNASIASVVRYASTGESFPDGMRIGGVVTANDEEGNFYRSIILEDPTGAVEINLGLYDLAALYPLGAQVVADISGLVTLPYNGVCEIGRAVYSWSDYRVEPLASRKDVAERIIVTSLPGAVEPLELRVSELGEEMCGRIVRILSVVKAADEEGERWGTTDYGSEADRVFVDVEDGSRVIVRTSRYADFAALRIPLSTMHITGVLYRDRVGGEDVFVVKPRIYEDFEW